MPDPSDLLDGLNDAQREAVTATTGPVAIAAGAGTGKTRVVSHRAAYAVATGVVDERRILLVTFTDKAGREMAERVAGLGMRSVTARTFHSAALAQLRYFWPSRHDDQPLPDVLADKWRILSPLARRLPGGYRFTPTRDLIDEIEWAKSRRLRPDTYEARAERAPPIPMNLFVRLFDDYERVKRRQGVIDFDDILSLTVDLLEEDEEAVAQVRSRYSWFTVDEFQDTTPLQYRLLELWLGERRDLCVVGDEDQTIYSFAGATPAHLAGFAARWQGARVIPLLDNYRSSPQVLELANRLLAASGRSKRLTATRGSGPKPAIVSVVDGDAETAHVVDEVRGLIDGGVAANEIAVLVRLNAQIAAFEAAFTRAGIPYQVRGQRFFERRDVKGAIEELRRAPDDLAGEALVEAVAERWGSRLGFDPAAKVDGREAVERQAALVTLLTIVREVATVSGESAAEGESGQSRDGAETGDLRRDEVVEELSARAKRERAGSADGVELLTFHRAKGLEWDAVFLPSLEEGLLPVAQAADDVAALEEERRLLYVGITRARVHLSLSWAVQRASASGKLQRRTMSRFLRDLGAVLPARSAAVARPRTAADGRRHTVEVDAEDEPLLEALKAWRLERAREDQVPAYVVASDATLAGIATRRPSTDSGLLDVSGIGPSKLEKYGPEILRLVGDA
jgi:DNA helicase-2/ATP-dependent DNA helicase PcrA